MSIRIDIVGIGLGAVIAGLSLLFPRSTLLGWAFLASGGLLSLGSFLHFLFNRFRARSGIPFFTSQQGKKFAQKIYSEARERGGELFATHIFPRTLEPEQDIAAESLRIVNSSAALRYERIVITDNPDTDIAWLTKLFGNVDSEVKLLAHVLARYPLQFSRFVRTTVPRVNLLLYRRGNRYMAMIGLDRVSRSATTSRQRSRSAITEEASFGVFFESKEAFEALLDYFIKARSTNREVVTVEGMQEYINLRVERTLPAAARTAIDAVLEFSDRTPWIVHVGIFGSLAKRLSGLYPDAGTLEHESDVDLLVVFDPQMATKEMVFAAACDLLAKDRFDVVDSSRDDYFYDFRAKEKTTIDLEAVPIHSEFYVDYPLLGSSIFSYYLQLFSPAGHGVGHPIRIPDNVFMERARWKILVEDRKGLRNFQKKMSEHQRRVDPRRIVSLVLRNLAWAMMGHHPATTTIAIGVMEGSWAQVFPTVGVGTAKELLRLTREQIEENYPHWRAIAKAMTEQALVYAESKQS